MNRDIGATPSGPGCQPAASAETASQSGIPSAALLALAERCEQATESGRKLDTEIWQRCVASMEQIATIEIGREEHGEREAEFRLDRMMDGARYTASIDAAMTLVPEGPYPVRLYIDKPATAVFIGEIEVAALTAPLALCAAALRARAAQ